MKKDKQGNIVLTNRESKKIVSLLQTLAAMSGGLDEYFSKECKSAEKMADKIEGLLIEVDELNNKVVRVTGEVPRYYV